MNPIIIYSWDEMNVFQDGVRLYKEGKYSEAVEKLHTVAVAEHGNHKAWNALGVALSKTGELDQAIVCFENALSLDPGNQTYVKNLDRARVKRGMHGIQIQGTISLSPQDVSASGGEDNVRSMQVKQSTFVWEGLSSGTSADDSSDFQQTDISEPDISEIVAKPEDHQSADLLNRALSLFGQASYHGIPDLMQESLDYVERSLELNPGYFEAWQLKVSILSSMGKDNPAYLTEAFDACEHALAIKPDQASMWFHKGGILESLGKYEEAVAAYDQSYFYSSDEPMRLGIILMRKGAALEAIGHDTEALLAYEQVQVQDRFFGEAMEKKAVFMEKIGNRSSAVTSLRTAGLTYMKGEQYEKAIDIFNRLLAYSPGDEEATYNKGVASLTLYEKTLSKTYLEDALESFDAALRLQPGNMTYLIQKGRCLLDLGRFEEGLQSLDRALWINPGDGITLMNKGIALYQLSRHEEALKYFNLVTTNYPEHAAPWMMKSRIHLDWKQYDTALEEINQALEKSPDDPRSWELKAVILRALGREDEAISAEEHARA